MTLLDAGTRLCAVLGHPIAHSLSPAIQNAALRHDGRNAVYLAFDVGPDDLPAALDGLLAARAVGLNVTIPHKEASARLSAAQAPAVERSGSANTLVATPSGWEAHSTDGPGVLGALADMGVHVRGARCVLLGAGGAGRAAAWALAEAGADLVVSNRTAERAEAVVAELSAAGHSAGFVPWDSREDAASAASVIVNATAAGLEGSPPPLDPDVLSRASVGGCRALLDLVYALGETSLVKAGREAGLVAADGLGVLVHQAAASYELFWGEPAPVGVMLEAAARAAGRTPAESHDARPPLV